MPVTVVPRRPEAPIRAVHVTAYAWADDDSARASSTSVRRRRSTRSSSTSRTKPARIGWAPAMPLASRIGSRSGIYDLEGCARPSCTGIGVRVIGRIVCFRDPVHAAAAWKRGRRNEVVQTPTAAPTRATAASPTSRAPPCAQLQHRARPAAAEARRRRDPLRLRAAPGRAALLDALPRTAAARRSGDRSLPAREPEGARRHDALPRRVGLRRRRDAARGGRPGHPGDGARASTTSRRCSTRPLGAGRVRRRGPERAAVRRSSAPRRRTSFGRCAAPAHAIVNWLQDFSYGREYSSTEVRAQIKASRDAGVDDFILWDAAVEYTPDALDASAEVPALALSTSPPKDAPRPVRLADRKAPAAGAAAPTSTTKPVRRPLPGLPPNELGTIPVVMHHMIRPDQGRRVRSDAGEFRTELDYLSATRLHADQRRRASSAASWTCLPDTTRLRSRSTTRPPISSTSRRTADVKPATAVGSCSTSHGAAPASSPPHLLRQPHAIRQRHGGEARAAVADWHTDSRIGNQHA